MTVYNRGDVVLVGFVFSDESAKKTSPRCRHQLCDLQPLAARDHRRGHHEQCQTPSVRRSFDSWVEVGWATVPVVGDRNLPND